MTARCWRRSQRRLPRVLSAGNARATGRRRAAWHDADRSLPLARERQGSRGRRLDARAACGDRAVPRPQRAAGAGHEGRARRAISIATRPTRRCSSTAANSSSGRGAASRRRSSTRGSTAARRCCSIRSRSTLPARRGSARVVPNRDATRLAVGVYAQGTERKDFRIIDSTTGAQIGPVITGLDSFGWARDERYAFITPRTAESDANQEPMRCLRASARRRPPRRRAAACGERREELLRRSTSRRRPTSPCSRPAISGRTRSASGRSVRAPSRGRSMRATSFAPRRSSSATGCISAPTTTPPNWKLMAASYAKPEFRDWTTLIRGAGDRAGRCDGHAARGSSRRCARTCCRSSSCTT